MAIMAGKYNVIKTSWKLWIGFFLLIGLLVLLESFFNITIPEYFIFVVLALILCIYLAGFYMAWKNKQGGE